MTAVLDASAVLALIYREPGCDTVTSCLDDAAISAVNYSEVLAKLIRYGHPQPRAALDGLCGLGITIHPFTTESAADAAGLWPETSRAGLSLGDRACLALAASIGGTALTADHPWKDLSLDIPIQIIR